MSRPAECYAQAMLELQYPMDVVEQAQAIWECCPALSEALTNPTISIPEKEAVVRKVFPDNRFLFRNGSGCSEGISGGSAEFALRAL